jgi:hypothetical protein
MATCKYFKLVILILGAYSSMNDTKQTTLSNQNISSGIKHSADSTYQTTVMMQLYYQMTKDNKDTVNSLFYS